MAPLARTHAARLCFSAAVNRKSAPEPDGLPARRIRRRHQADLPECVLVLADVHETDGYPVNWPDDPVGWLSEPSLLAAWVADSDEQIMGHIGLCRGEAGDAAPDLWSKRAGSGAEMTAVVSRLFVAPEVRGRGLGALLVAQAAWEARELGLHPVLDVVASDIAAVALYESLGWSLLATVEQQWEPAKTVTVHCYAAPA